MTSSDSNLTLSWKRPWTIEEIIQSSQCWSLAADSGVCELLKSFSTDLLNEVAQVNNNINELSVESKQTNVIIQNAFNEFCMLANNQFMENLVEDVASCPITYENIKNNESNPSKEDKLAQIIPQVTESLKMGFQVLENQFEMLDMQKMAATTASPEDSDTEMRSYAQVDYLTNEPIYHPKDPYENRHLPHLIGTKAFIEDETLGIGYLDDLDNQSEYASAHSDHSSVSDGLSSSSNHEDDDDESGDNNTNKPRDMSKVPSSSDDNSGMFPEDDDQSETDMFIDDNKVSNSIKNPDSNPSVSKQLSIMDQLNNQLNEKFGVENIHKPNKQTENNWQDDGDDDSQKNDSGPFLSQNDDSKKILPLQSSTNHIIIRPGSVKSADEDSDDLFGEIQTPKMKNENKPVSNSITQMPSVITSTPNNVDKNSNIKPKSKKPFSPNSISNSDSDDLFDTKPSNPKPMVRSRKSNSKDITKNSIDRPEKEINLVKEDPAKVIPAKKQSETDSDDDLFGLKVSQPAKSTASVANPVAKPVVKPVLKQTKPNLFNSDDDADDLFNTTSKVDKPPPAQTAEKSNNVTNLPKVESDNKINTKTLKDETSKPKSFSKWLDSSSDDDLLLPKSIPLVVSKPLNDDKSASNKQENIEVKVEENIKSENVKEIQQINNSNSSANNLGGFNEDKSVDDFDDLFITNKTNENKTSSSEFKNSNIITDDTNVSNNSKVIDPLAPPKRKISFNISSNSDEYDSNKSPVIIPRNSLNKIPQSSASSGALDVSSPENSNSNPLDIVSEVKSFRESLPKLPPGAKPLFGSSLMDEMKTHQKSKLSLNSETETDVKDSSNLFTPDKIDLFGSFENKTESNIQLNKQDFKNKLQLKLNEKPFRNTVEQVHKPKISEENGIDLEIPAEEVHQLNLLTKSRVKANPRRRPTMKKAGNGDTIPTLDPIIPESKTDSSIPQSIVESVPPIIVSNQSDDTSNIFADLPAKPNKKIKSNKKSTALSTNKAKKPVEVNAEEIDDIFTVATSKSKKAKNKSKIVSDPLGAL